MQYRTSEVSTSSTSIYAVHIPFVQYAVRVKPSPHVIQRLPGIFYWKHISFCEITNRWSDRSTTLRNGESWYNFVRGTKLETLAVEDLSSGV